MKDNPKVSILINNYNYGRFLQEAIDSALNQTYSPTEVIVVDDGSTDNSRKIIASYGNKIAPVLKENGGQASAFNAGFAASRGDIICFLDSDDAFMPEKVAEVVKAFGERQDLGWCCNRIQWVDINGKPFVPKSIPKDSSITKNTHEEPKREYDLREKIKIGKFRNKIPDLAPTSGLSFRRSLLQQILPMPEAKRIGLNDAYLDYTALGLSKFIILDKELTLYRVHDSNAYTVSNDSQRQRVKARINILTSYWMRVNFPSLSKFTNRLLAVSIGIYGRAGGFDGESQAFVKAYLSLATMLEKVEIYSLAFYYYLKNPKY
jgi:glycosyltransferase involved in cell wall biosynthesis